MSRGPKHPDPRKCSYCGGKGTVPVTVDGKIEEVRCPHCGGSGLTR